MGDTILCDTYKLFGQRNGQTDEHKYPLKLPLWEKEGIKFWTTAQQLNSNQTDLI